MLITATGDRQMGVVTRIDGVEVLITLKPGMLSASGESQLEVKQVEGKEVKDDVAREGKRDARALPRDEKVAPRLSQFAAPSATRPAN